MWGVGWLCFTKRSSITSRKLRANGFRGLVPCLSTEKEHLRVIRQISLSEVGGWHSSCLTWFTHYEDSKYSSGIMTLWILRSKDYGNLKYSSQFSQSRKLVKNFSRGIDFVNFWFGFLFTPLPASMCWSESTVLLHKTRHIQLSLYIIQHMTFFVKYYLYSFSVKAEVN